MIEENTNYTTVTGQEITIDKNISHDKGIMVYSKEMLEILWKQNPSWDERKDTMQEQEVFIGKTNDVNMPEWYRHKQSGKCLWLGKEGNIDKKFNKYISNFDIKSK